MNGINYTNVLNHPMQLSQTGAISRLSPLLKAIAVITLAFIAIAAVYLAISRGVFRRMNQTPHGQRTTPNIPPTSSEQHSAEKSFQIRIKAPDELYIQNLTFSMDAPIHQLQEQLCEYYTKRILDKSDPRCTNPNIHTIILQGKILDPNKTLRDYRFDPILGFHLVHDRSLSQPQSIAVEAVEKDPSSRKIEIILKTRNEELITMKVNPNDTVLHLQEQLCQYYQEQKKDSDVIDQRCFDPSYHRLVFAGKTLEAQRTLSDYGINEKAPSILVVHQRCR